AKPEEQAMLSSNAEAAIPENEFIMQPTQTAAVIPPEEGWLQGTQLAQRGGVLPEPVQRFQDGGTPANPAGQPDKYSRFRNYTQQIPQSTTPTWTPRRVSSPAAAPAMQMTDGLTPSQLAFKQANDKIAADRAAAAAAKAQPAQPAAQADPMQAQIAGLYNQQQGMRYNMGALNPRAALSWNTGMSRMDPTTGKITVLPGGYGYGQGVSRGGSRARGGMVYHDFAEGGVVPEPGQNFARGGTPLSDRDKRFQELLQQESRPGRDSQEARDRAAKRMSALEGRPQSSAYHE